MNDADRFEFYSDPENRVPAPGTPVHHRMAGMARCEHMSLGNVTAASCSVCGSLAIEVPRSPWATARFYLP